MKSYSLSALLICGVIAGTAVLPAHADENTEATQIQTLRSSSATLREKRDACAMLKHIGTAHCVDAVASLLTDPQLSLSARYVLETLPGKDAEKALLDALPKTSGALEVGAIQSLGQRRDAMAVPQLATRLSDQDLTIATASAEALAEIGGAKAVELLQHAVVDSTGTAHDAEVDGLLSCAQRYLESGKRKDALKIFDSLYSNEKSDAVREAAFRGIVLASGKKGIAQMKEAILHGDGPSQVGALQAAALLHESAANKALVEILPQGNLAVQLAIIQCLERHKDFSAVPALAKEANDSDADVSLAAINALGVVGDASVVDLLAGKAATGGADRTAARQSLLAIDRGPVAKRMEALLKTAPTSEKLELARALSGRGDQSAVPALMQLAQNGNDEERNAAFQALGQLAGGAQISRLVSLVTGAKNDDARSSAADALSAVFQRVQSSGKKANVSAFASAVQTGSSDARLALIPVCSEVAQEPVRVALRSAEADKDARIREAAIHALCETKDAELLPDLVKLACDTSLGDTRLLAVRGCVRLTTQEDGVTFPNAAKLDAFNQILATSLDTPEKQAVLSGLAAVADPKALESAVRLLDDSAVKAEAEDAVVRIATAISHSNPAEARAALKKVADESQDGGIKKAARAALRKIK